jgi:hypothetical protein
VLLDTTICFQLYNSSLLLMIHFITVFSRTGYFNMFVCCAVVKAHASVGSKIQLEQFPLRSRTENHSNSLKLVMKSSVLVTPN